MTDWLEDRPRVKGRGRVSLQHHLVRIGLLMSAVAVYLTLLASGTEVMFADGLRYVAQAEKIDQGSWSEAVAQAVDHPAYPLAIAAVHRLSGGNGPIGWQAAAQAASIIAGVLLVAPVYLFALELYGAPTAWLACLLTFLVPLTGHVLADVLAEGTFLLFWMTGCWTALRFLRDGRTGWLAATIVFAGLAYMTRPEGLLLPLALAGTLVLMVCRPASRFTWPVWIRSVLLLIAGPLLLAGPYVALKGGIGTKPAVARLLGLSARSAAMAVERERPLDPEQSTVTTYVVASRAVARAVQGAVSSPLLVLAIASLFAGGGNTDRSRKDLFLALLLVDWLLALVRLHATGGYCTPRHAMIFALPVIAAAAYGLNFLVDRCTDRFCNGATGHRRALLGRAMVGICLVAGVVLQGRDLIAPINPGFRGYRQAGEWLVANSPRDARVLDLKGWAAFYGKRAGYTFEELAQAEHDPALGWVVAHDALLIGPWSYCDALRRVVGNRSPVKSFPAVRRPGIAQVHVFDVSGKLARAGSTPAPASRRQ
jgi:Dolichyl-phosphate-mannose-protein mannosyltransferase